MILAINYADETFKLAQKYNTKTAYEIGKVDKVIEYGPENIDKKYREENFYAFVQNDKLVGNYGLWRPHIVKDAYEQLDAGDFLIYSDSGVSYIDNVISLINVMKRDKLDIMVFEDTRLEKTYTKRDIFLYLEMDIAECTNTHQRESGCFIIQKSELGELFVNEFYRLSLEAPFLFTDEDNRMGEKNYDSFIENRHNQSVFSVLSKKMRIPAYRDPTQWGMYRKIITEKYGKYDEVLERSTYPRTFLSHRNGKITEENAKELEVQYLNVCNKKQGWIMLLGNIQNYYRHNEKEILEIFGEGISNNSNICVYGAGSMGRDIYRVLSEKKLAKELLWVDTNYSSYLRLKGRLFSPLYLIKKIDKIDYIIIAVVKKEVATEIQDYLVKNGINKNKIVWFNEEFVNKEF